MITIEQEEKIREMLAVGCHSDNKIASKVGVSRHAVEWVSNTIDSFEAIPIEDRKAVRELLVAGFPVQAIEIKAKVPKDQILAVRRYYYLCKRRIGWRGGKCPTCGSLIGEKLKLKHIDYSASEISVANLPHMHKIVCDIYELGKLGIIKNPLFFNIAKQAEKLLEKTNDQS